MKNAIKYYYNLDIKDIHQYKQKYKFSVMNRKFILYPCDNTLKELEEKYTLQMYINSLGIKCHRIIKNNNNQIRTIINNIEYILIEIQTESRIINIEDITLFSKIYIKHEFFESIDRTSWTKMWGKKIDYIEYQNSQFRKKYPVIRESCDYYIGITENCISLLANNKSLIQMTACMHNRLNEKTTTIDFYNPLNFIVDERIRDIAEYLTPKLYEEENITSIIYNYINNNKLSSDELFLLFIRLIYPSNYFDLCELIIETKTEENQLMKLLNRNYTYEKNLKKVYIFIKKMISIPEIEWISKINQY